MSQVVKMPKGIPYIIGNEAAERYSYYGMRSILFVFMTKYLMDASGNPDFMTEPQANVWYHNFGMAVYFFPIIGALISDVFWGKYKTIITLSIVYCIGHLVLAILETRMGLAVGLGLIAIGSGGIKPCVSAHVGDQFGEDNKHLISKVFAYFYFSINFGAFFSILITPWLLEHYGPQVAFGTPGLLMLLATIVFYMGHKKFTSVPPVGWTRFKDTVLSKKGLKAFLNLGLLYIFVGVFWALFEQQGSSWIAQAQKMNLHFDLRFGPFQWDWLTFDALAAQLNSVNAIFILMFIPLFNGVIYPFFGKFGEVTPLRKIFVGFFITASSFVVLAICEKYLVSGVPVHAGWQILAFALLTSGEIMISITALEFSYTQAPNEMKSFVMGIFLLSVSLGNLIAGTVNRFIQDADGNSTISGADYFWFFVALCAVTGVLFGIFASKYKMESYIQDHDSIEA